MAAQCFVLVVNRRGGGRGEGDRIFCNRRTKFTETNPHAVLVDQSLVLTPGCREATGVRGSASNDSLLKLPSFVAVISL